MSIRIIDFTNGFTSSSAPLSDGVAATQFEPYADDAAFVTANGTANDGDVYYNTTINKVKIYENGAWVENASFEA